MLFLFNKFRKIKRTDVIDQIIQYQKELDELEHDVYTNSDRIKELYKKGSKESNLEIKELIANKILFEKKGISKKINRIKFLQYNVNVLENLKLVLDDMEFSKSKANAPLNKLLKNSKNLNDFLIKSNNCRNDLEQTLINTTNTFEEFDSMLDKDNEIYGNKEGTEDIMAQFELYSDETFDDEEIKNKENELESERKVKNE